MGLTLLAGLKLIGSTGMSDSPLLLSISPKAVLWLFVMVVPLSMLFSATLLAISLFARSFKEAQSYISPLTILVLIPAVISVLPGADLNFALSLVPVLNTSLVSKEIVSGTYHWNFIALIFASSCVYAAAALWIAIRLFQREDVLFQEPRSPVIAGIEDDQFPIIRLSDPCPTEPERAVSAKILPLTQPCSLRIASKTQLAAARISKATIFAASADSKGSRSTTIRRALPR